MYDTAQNIGQASATFTTQNDLSALPQPIIPQHSPNIRLTDIVYNGGSGQLDPSDISLLQNSVDLVIDDPIFLGQVDAISPNTPQLIYTNVSSVYLSLLTDWLNYADAHGYSREEAFYHVTQATPFAGAGGSTQPVNWFWGVYSGGSGPSDRTWQAAQYRRQPSAEWGNRCTSATPTSSARSTSSWLPGRVPAGRACWSTPRPWTLPATQRPGRRCRTLTNTTAGLTQSGQITFDPPANWKAASRRRFGTAVLRPLPHDDGRNRAGGPDDPRPRLRRGQRRHLRRHPGL